jgi:hypothetical protein
MEDDELNYTGDTSAQAQQQSPPSNEDTQGAIPDVGPAPEAAQDTVGEGFRKIGNKLREAGGSAMDNLKNSGPGRLVGKIGEQFSDKNDPGAAQGGNKRIVGYLTGADGDDPTTIDRIGQMIDPQGQMSAADRNVHAIARVRDEQGDNAAWKLMQANRNAYNYKAGVAFNKANEGDMNTAIKAANEAQANVLDGSNIQFTGSEQGVTATVTTPGAQPQTYNLTREQFAKFNNIGQDGQWDKIMDKNAAETLKGIVGQGGGATPSKGGFAPNPHQEMPQSQKDRMATGSDTYATGGGWNKGTESISQREADASGDAREIRREYQRPEYVGKKSAAQAREDASYDMFPRAEVDGNVNAQRQRWMQEQLANDAKLENAVDVAKTKGDSANEGKKITADAARDVAKTKLAGWQYASDQKLKAAQATLDAKIKQMESTNANAALTRAAKVVQTKMATGKDLTEKEQNYIDTLEDEANGQVNTVRPGQQQGGPSVQGKALSDKPAAQGNSALPPKESRVAGQTRVTTSKGKFVWNGQGWDKE